MKSVLQERKECIVCETALDLHCHHVFYGTANRKKSEQYGYKIWLCSRHHNMSDEGAHFNGRMALALKQMAQEHFEGHYGSRSDFIHEFGKSWL